MPPFCSSEYARICRSPQPRLASQLPRTGVDHRVAMAMMVQYTLLVPLRSEHVILVCMDSWESLGVLRCRTM